MQPLGVVREYPGHALLITTFDTATLLYNTGKPLKRLTLSSECLENFQGFRCAGPVRSTAHQDADVVALPELFEPQGEF